MQLRRLSSLIVIVLCATCFTGCQPSSTEPSGAAGAKSAGPPSTPREALERMAATYRAAKSYSDEAVGRFVLKSDGQDVDRAFSFAVCFERPNRLFMHVYGAQVVCDGQKLRARIEGLDKQVLVKDAPAELSLQAVYGDPLLAEAANMGPVGGSLQLMMLLVDKPLTQLLEAASEQAFLEPAKLDARDCYRVSLGSPLGATVFWIDRESFLLRRLELPVEELRRQEKAAGRNVERASSTVDFNNACFDAPLPAEKLALKTPAGAEEVKLLVRPNPALLLGQKVPDFKFLDGDRKAVTPAVGDGKVLVLEFWATNCPPCRVTLPRLQTVAQKYKDNAKVAFLAVSVDPPDMAQAALTDLFKELKTELPIVRDQEAQVNRLFFIDGIPTLLLVGPTGVVEDFEVGVNADLEKSLAAKIDKLLAGEHLYTEGLKNYQEQIKKAEQNVAKQAEMKEIKPQDLPAAATSTASKPARLQLRSLWKCADVPMPGNILVVPRAEGAPRILVLDGWRAIAELGPDGKVRTRRELDIPKQEVISLITSGVDGAGKRFFAGWTVSQQQVHLFDDDWKRLVDFPAEALENKHPGISHALLADLSGEGQLMLYVGYWGSVGVQGVSLDGQRVWSNRSLENVLYLTLAPPDAQRRRGLMCLDSRGMVVLLNAKGERQGEALMGTRPLQTLLGADLDGNGQPKYCGIAQKELGSYMAVGLDTAGKELWTYEFPKGHPQVPIDFVTVGQVTGPGPAQWVFPAADGSIHILGADGKLVDRFNYGTALNGLAVTRLDGQCVLLIASPQGVEAIEVK